MTTWQDIIETGDVQAVRDYIAQGADVNAKDDRGNTALDIARENGYDDIAALPEKKGK